MKEEWQKQRALREYHWELYELYQGRGVNHRRINELWRAIEFLEAELGVTG